MTGQPIAIEPLARQKTQAAFIVNGERVEVAFPPQKTLLELLREELGLTGTKHGCELGECGTCTVLVDGTPILSCLALAISYADRPIETIEGMAQGAVLHPLQDAFADLGAAQCLVELAERGRPPRQGTGSRTRTRTASAAGRTLRTIALASPAQGRFCV